MEHGYLGALFSIVFDTDNLVLAAILLAAQSLTSHNDMVMDKLKGNLPS